jgi:hypothetical protein
MKQNRFCAIRTSYGFIATNLAVCLAPLMGLLPLGFTYKYEDVPVISVILAAGEEWGAIRNRSGLMCLSF